MGEQFNVSGFEPVSKEALKGIEKALGSALHDIGHQAATQFSGNSEIAIPGLRQQIIDNASILVPYLNGSKAGKTSINTLATSNEDAAKSNSIVRIVTMGEGSTFRALLLCGTATSAQKLMHSDEAIDTPSALSSLLKKTEKKLATTFGVRSNSFTKLNKAAGLVIGNSPTKIRIPAHQEPLRVAAVFTSGSPTKKDSGCKTFTEAKRQHARIDSKAASRHTRIESTTTSAQLPRVDSTTSTIGLWAATGVNNGGFLDECGEPDGEGNDSGFDSGDREPHPNRSYHADLAVMDAARAAGRADAVAVAAAPAPAPAAVVAPAVASATPTTERAYF